MSSFLCLCVEDLPPFGAEEYSFAIKLAKKLVLTEYCSITAVEMKRGRFECCEHTGVNMMWYVLH